MEWRKVIIDGFTFVVSDDGCVINCSGRVMKQEVSHKGYLTFSAQINKKRRRFFVHRLIASAFIPNPLNLEQINHKNKDKTDNRIENLEWCNQSENTLHSYHGWQQYAHTLGNRVFGGALYDAYFNFNFWGIFNLAPIGFPIRVTARDYGMVQEAKGLARKYNSVHGKKVGISI